MVKFKKPTSLFKCWRRNRNFTQNTLHTRCQIKSPMWPHKIWRFRGGVNHTDDLPLKSPSMIYPKLSVRFTPPKITREDLPLKLPSTIYPPPPKSSNFEQNFRHTTSCFASQRSFLRKTNKKDKQHPCKFSVKKIKATGSKLEPS